MRASVVAAKIIQTEVPRTLNPEAILSKLTSTSVVNRILIPSVDTREDFIITHTSQIDSKISQNGTQVCEYCTIDDLKILPPPSPHTSNSDNRDHSHRLRCETLANSSSHRFSPLISSTPRLRPRPASTSSRYDEGFAGSQEDKI